MGQGKHSLHSYKSTYEDYEEENYFKKRLIIIILAVIIVITVILLIFLPKNNKEEIVNNNEIAKQDTEKMISVYQGYDVIGKIIIDEFKIEQYILDSKEDNALECGVSKLYGGTLNNYGNFCIAGHNKPGVFEKLAEMEVGDTFKIVEPNFKETEYEITEIYSSEADNLKCLMQNDEKVEITLVTCENASTTRLIVKAEEK